MFTYPGPVIITVGSTAMLVSSYIEAWQLGPSSISLIPNHISIRRRTAGKNYGIAIGNWTGATEYES